MSSAAEVVSTLRRTARRQKWMIGVGAALLTLVAMFIAYGFGLLSWWIEWPVKAVIYGGAAAIWAYSAKAIDQRVERQTQEIYGSPESTPQG